MALVLTEEQSMLRDSARGLISDKAPVSHLRQLRDSKDATGFSRELWKSFADMGFSGLLVPEEFGGMGRDVMAMVVTIATSALSPSASRFSSCSEGPSASLSR